MFRNEGPALSSRLIREGMEVAWGCWPGERLYTYVDARAVGWTNQAGHNPGYCFLRAGWRRYGRTGGGGYSSWSACRRRSKLHKNRNRDKIGKSRGGMAAV